MCLAYGVFKASITASLCSDSYIVLLNWIVVSKLLLSSIFLSNPTFISLIVWSKTIAGNSTLLRSATSSSFSINFPSVNNLLTSVLLKSAAISLAKTNCLALSVV